MTDVASTPIKSAEPRWQAEATEISLADIPDTVLETVSIARANEILRQAELRQQALLAVATAADNRAVQFLVASSALAAAATGAAAALGSTGSPVWVWFGLIGAAACYIVAAGCAAWAARPEAEYQPPGLVPDQLWNTDALSFNELNFRLLIIGAAHTAIWRSQAASQERGQWTKRALWAAAVAPGIGAIVSAGTFLPNGLLVAWAVVKGLV